MNRLCILAALIATQIVAALIIGYLAINLTPTEEYTRKGAYYSGADLSGMPVEDALKAVELIDGKKIEGGIAAFIFNDREFLFSFSDIELAANYDLLVHGLTAKGSDTYRYSLFSGFTRVYTGAPKPIYEANSDLLKHKLLQIKDHIEIMPQNADIHFSASGGITKTPSSDGVYFDVAGKFEHIFALFLTDPFAPFQIGSNSMVASSAIIKTAPRVTDAMLEGVTAALSSIAAPIPDRLDIELLGLSAEAINRVWIPRAGDAGAPFSFLRYIRDAGLPDSIGYEEYSFVASVLLHALLAAGADYSSITFDTSSNMDFYEALPGFGVSIDNNDILFSSSFGDNIVIFASMENGDINITIAGNPDLPESREAPHEVISSVEGALANLYINNEIIFNY